MAKIVFMGAGSSVFVKNVVGDCMLSPVLKDSEFALYDIDPVRLDDSRRMLTALNSNMGGHAVITAYLGVENRREALRGASYVINAIQVGLYEPCTVTDFEVPKKYGLRQTIGDTLGIGGIFRALRTIEKSGAEIIIAEDPGSTGIALALRDRLERAAGK